MKPKNPQSPTNQRDRWMLSYVNVLSILLIFFMVEAARSLPLPPAHAPATQASSAVAEVSAVTEASVVTDASAVTEAVQPAEPEKAEQPAPPAEARPAADHPEAEPPAGLPAADRHRKNLLRAQERLRQQGLEPKLEARGLVISVPQVILFSSGEDTVNPQALSTISQIADVLRDIPNEVRLVGHADASPVHNRRFRSNWDLSMARSEKILELLSGRFGIAESRLSIASYGPWRPAATNDTADGRASNRRVEIVILDESDSENQPAE